MNYDDRKDLNEFAQTLRKADELWNITRDMIEEGYSPAPNSLESAFKMGVAAAMAIEQGELRVAALN